MVQPSLATLAIATTAILMIMIYLLQSKWSFHEIVTDKNVNSDPLFVIIMSSYERQNGKSPYYIRKAVQSILAQSYKNWQLFVTGDGYKNETDFRALFRNITSSKLFLHNLQKPGEQGRLHGIELWQSGGVTAMNNAIERAERHHNSCKSRCDVYLTNLDDDDTWSKDHLHEFLKIYIRFPSVVFAWTKGYFCYSGGNPYPLIYVPQTAVNNWRHGFGGQILHSSFSWKMNTFYGFRYRAIWDFPPNFQGSKTADFDLFERIRIYIKRNAGDYFHSNQATIEHLVEQGNTCAKNGTLWYPD